MRRRGGFLRAGAASLLLVSACLLLLAWVTPSAAQQSEADILVAEAILAYDAKRYDDALRRLQEALRRDPDHVEALYYTGLVHLALRQPALAVEPLEKARAKNPTDVNIRFQLGVAYFSQELYERAEPLLSQLFAEQPRIENLGYYVGFMRYRQRDYQGAVQAFQAGTSADPDIQQLTRFYSGLALAILGRPGQAAAEINEALRLQPASPITGPAERLRDTVVAAAERERRYRLEVRLGGFYDDNVAVIPDKTGDPLVQVLRNRRHASPGWLGSLSGQYAFLRSPDFNRGEGYEATASYSIFTTQNSDLNAFSIVDQLGVLGGAYRGLLDTPLGKLPYQGSLQYAYDFLTLGGDEFVTRHTVSPVFTLAENEHNTTALQGRYQHKRYAASANPLQAEKRDGSNFMVGIIHFIGFEGFRHLLKVGYQADWDLTQGGNFTYFGSRLLAGVQLTAPWSQPLADLRFTYDFDVHLRDYRNFNTILPLLSPNTKARTDTEFTHIFRLTYPLTDKSKPVQNAPFLSPVPGSFSLLADFQAIRADSNLDAFSFNRNVVSLSIIWSY